MTAGAGGRRRRGARLLAAVTAGVVTLACAEPPTRVASHTPAPHATERSAPAPYEDRVLETGPQPDIELHEEGGYDASGWARGLRLDYSLGATRGPSDAVIRALAFSGHVETPQHGTLSLQANLIHSTSDAMPMIGVPRTDARFGTWRIDQRALPLEGFWLADHSAGDIHTQLPPLARGLTRVFLPSLPMSGLGGRWELPYRLELNASAGRPGVFTGLDVSGFELTRGQVATGGAQVRLSDERTSRVDAALQLMHARDAQELGMPANSEASSAWASLSWEGLQPWAPPIRVTNSLDPLATRPGGARVQLNLLQSGGLDRRAVGGWLDGSWRTELVQNTAGLFRFPRGLRWGAMTMPSDLQGAYWRGELPLRQWQVGWSGETSTSVTGAGATSSFGSVYGRYILSLRDAVDATLSLRSGSAAAGSLQVNWDHRSDWGQTRWRSSFLRTRSHRTAFFGADHAWVMTAPTVLATSLGWRTTDAPAMASPVWSWGLLASASPIPRFTLDASLHGAQGGGLRSLLANVGVSWQFARDWALALRYTESRGQDPQSTEVVSALTAATQASLPARVTSRSVQLNLRYEVRAGTLPLPLGGTRTSGAGSLGGTVYLDGDHNGRREASEQGVPNVVIVLDGRFATRTDASGRYAFPSVVAGEHVLQIQPDNIPLPWSPASQAPVRTTVVVRGTTVEDFPLQRER